MPQALCSGRWTSIIRASLRRPWPTWTATGAVRSCSAPTARESTVWTPTAACGGSAAFRGHYGRSSTFIADLNGRTVALIGGAHLHTAPCLWCLDAATGERVWKFDTRLQVYGGISVGDVNGDGKPEVIVGDKSTTTYCLTADGAEIWKTEPQGAGTWFSPTIADIDGDGRQEIVLGPRQGGVSQKALLILSDAGEALATYEGSATFASTVAVGDVDGDGELELLAALSPKGEVHCFTAGGGADSAVVSGEYHGGPSQTCLISLGKRPGESVLPDHARGELSVPAWNPTYGSQPISVGWNGVAPTEALLSVTMGQQGEGVRARYYHLLGGETGAEVEIAPTRAGEYACEIALWDGTVVAAEWSGSTAARLDDAGVLCKEAAELERTIEALVERGTDVRSIAALAAAARQHASACEGNAPADGDYTDQGDWTSYLRAEMARLSRLAEGFAVHAAHAAHEGAGPVFCWWLADPWSKRILDAAPPEGKLPEAADVFAYNREYESAAFAVLNTTAKPLNVRVVVDRATDHTPYRKLVSVRRVVGAATNSFGREPEALPELGAGGTLSIAPWSVEVVWLTFHAEGLLAGMHEFPVTIQPVEFGASAQALKVRWEIAPLSLPEKRRFATCVWRAPSDYAKYGEEVARAVKEDMAAHGINIFCISAGRMEFDAEGTPKGPADWSAMDAQIEGLRDIALRFLLHEPALVLEGDVDRESDAYRRAFGHWARALKNHLLDIGLSYEDVAWYPVDEACLVGGQRIRQFISRAKLMRWADPNLPIYTNPVGYVTKETLSLLAPYVDVWCPYLPLLRQEGSRGDEVRAFFASCGKDVWSYEADWRKRRQPPIQGWRARGWSAFHYGMNGFGFWTYSYPTGDDVWVSSDSGDAEWSLVFAQESAVPSRAWEASRDSMEDWHALAMLKDEIDRVEALGTATETVAEAKAALRAATEEVDATQRGATEVGRSAREYPIEPAVYARLRRSIADWTLKLKAL